MARKSENKIHAVKSWRQQFKAVVMGGKRFEVRKDDRGYKVGDLLYLREYDHRKGKLLGPHAEVRITHMMKGVFGLPPDIAVLQIEVLGVYGYGKGGNAHEQERRKR